MNSGRTISDDAIEVAVLNTIRTGRGVSRPELVDSTKVPWTSLDRITKGLIDKNMVEWSDIVADKKPGRDPKLLRVRPDFGAYVGIEVGGSTMKMVVLDFAYQTLAEASVGFHPSEASNAAQLSEFLGKLADFVHQGLAIATKFCPGGRLGIGLAFPGQVETSNGIVQFAANLAFVRNLRVRDSLQRKFKLDLAETPIWVDHDSKCAARAEKLLGGPNRSSRKETTYLCVMLGTGVGTGIVINKAIHYGVTGVAGEIGHAPVQLGPDAAPCACGQTGCLETLVSGPAVAKAAKDRSEKESMVLREMAEDPQFSAEDVYRAAIQGDATAKDIFEKLGENLGMGLVWAVNLLNPELVILSGGVTEAFDLFHDRLVGTLTSHCTSGAETLRIEVSRLGRLNVALGAALGACEVQINSLFNDG